MLSKLRTDIRQKLRNTRTVLVNGELFQNIEPGEPAGKNINNVLNSLSDLGVDIYIYGDSGSPFDDGKTNIKFWPGNSEGLVEHLSGNGRKINFNDTISIGYSQSDSELMSRTVFSFTPASASLEAKMSSSYSSHMDGMEAFLELCSLIVSANTYPYGFSK